MKYDALEQQNHLMEAISFLKSQTSLKPKICFVLGSGLSSFANKMQDCTHFPFEKIPRMAAPTVQGHKGEISLGYFQDVPICVIRGRYHKYEGFEDQEVVFPLRLARKLGAEIAVITNAAGGINPDFHPGDLVCIEDQINLTGFNVLEGPNLEKLGPRFPDMSYAFHPELKDLLKKCADKLKLNLKSGNYCGVLGPSYETPAEIRMMRILGADMVGMSTVQEVIAANHCGLKVCGVSCITNYAAGLKEGVLDHNEVEQEAQKMINHFSSLLTEFTQQARGFIE